MIHHLSFYLAFLPLISSSCIQNYQSQEEIGYAIVYANNNISKKWAKYLYRHLNKRAKDKKVLLNDTEVGFLTIHLSLDENNSYDYCIKRVDKNIDIVVKDESTMLWIVYQIISNLALNDNSIQAKDLAPAIISLNDTCKDFDFSYREPYFLPNLEFEFAPIIGTDMVETAWGLWGHGMSKVVDKDSSKSIYATSKGRINLDQFCFSSSDLYEMTKSYIMNNYGSGDKQSYKFMLMPNDNKIVCMCPKCSAIGNSIANATPAVSEFITKLAAVFPKHTFFTTVYKTTYIAPKEIWPDNTGVMISTIDLPKGIALKPSASLNKFQNSLKLWKEKVSQIYIWDYAANFDDWLTPIPTLYGLQQQLQFYKEHGVKGVFLNASGYDYSPFDDMKTYVSAALMMDINAPVDNLCEQYLTHFYPVSGKYLLKYYLFLEKTNQKLGKPYEIYGNFRSSVVAAHPDKFVEFYDGLDSFIYKATDEEKRKLEKLQVALSFTRLCIASLMGSAKYGYARLENNTMIPNRDIKLHINKLKHHKDFADFKNYKEVGGVLDDFIAYYEHEYNNPIQNQLIGSPLNIVSKLDDDYKNSGILQDGILGYAKDYHHGWILISAESFESHILVNKDLKKGKNLYLRFLQDKKHNILPPEKVVIYRDDQIYIEVLPKYDPESNIVEVSAELDLSETKSITILFVKQINNGKSMACDEIIIN